MSYLNESLCNFNFYGKAVPFPFADIIMVELLCFSSVFFSQKGVIFFFPLTHFLIKLEHQKKKHHLVKWLKVIFAIYF